MEREECLEKTFETTSGEIRSEDNEPPPLYQLLDNATGYSFFFPEINDERFFFKAGRIPGRVNRTEL